MVWLKVLHGYDPCDFWEEIMGTEKNVPAREGLFVAVGSLKEGTNVRPGNGHEG